MQPSKEEKEQIQRNQDSIAWVQKQEQRRFDSIAKLNARIEELEKASQQEDLPETKEVVTTIVKAKYGDFGNAAMQDEKFYILENDVIKLKIFNRGGRVYSVELKDYVTYDTLPLILFDSDSSIFGFDFINNTRSINSNDLYFNPYWNENRWEGQDSILISGDETVSFSMRLYPDLGDDSFDTEKYVEYLYTMKGDDYMVDLQIKMVGVQDLIATNYNTLDLHWGANLRKQEKAVDRWNAPTIYYKHMNDDVDYLSETKDDEEAVNTRLKWISFKQHFFCITLITDQDFENANMATFTDPEPSNPKYLKSMYALVGLPYNQQQNQQFDLSFYFGPLKYKTLRKYKLDLEQQIPLGWSFFLLAWINQYAVIPVFDFLGSFGWNYGIIILILTILLKIVLFPIAYKTYKSSAKMRALKPEIEEINKKFPKKEESMKKQQATMALYKQAGVNPLAGCIPMLLQMPILIAMFRFFPSSIELRQKSFLWAHDLSSYDSIWTFPNGFEIPFYGDHVSLFTLLMTVSTIFYTKLNNQMMSSSQQMPGMKWMMYLMPVMFLGIFNNYASALSYYYLLANLITFGQMYIFRLAIDDKKLRQQIQLNKKKPKKKSGFQKRLEDAAKKRGYPPPKKK